MICKRKAEAFEDEDFYEEEDDTNQMKSMKIDKIQG